MTNKMFTREYVKNSVRDIVLANTFADTVVFNQPISSMMTFPEDADWIKEGIMDTFGLKIRSDISVMPLNKLITNIFMYVKNSGKYAEMVRTKQLPQATFVRKITR